MGISGLLPLLKSIHKHTTLKKFAGQTIGIDGYGWLHRGAVACALELALDKPTTKYVDFAIGRVRMLLDFGIIPYVVFDGDNLPSKAGTNDERRKRRSDAKVLGLSLYRAGKVTQAQQELQKATGVTPHMARLLIEELKKLDVQYVVAPYEADAQLTYLERKGIVNGILSEDSDLLVFGVKRLITKLNQYGECIEIERADFPLCKEISLAGWTDAMFRRMAILSGCDYLPNIDKMGLKTAYRFVRKYKEAEKTIRMIAFEGKFCVPQDYMEKFKQAELTFIHHRVFCPIQQKMVFLTDLERDMDENDMPYLGPHVEPEEAIGVACGDLNPKNKLPIEVKTPALMRPPLRDDRRQSLGTPTDLKKRSSIDSFFKPQRTPLQELDPNSLTPSPSQQRLLERNRNASWEPRPVNSAPQLRRAATAMPLSGSTTDHRSFLSRASTLSSFKPLKRQRLCSENDGLTPSSEVTQSPFFASNHVAMSPLDKKKSRNRKAKSEFDVWSDDSVDGILLGLVGEYDTTDTRQPSQQDVSAAEVTRFASPAADVDVIPQSSPPASSEESQGAQYSNNGTQTRLLPSGSSNISQVTVADSSRDSEDNDPFDDLLDYHVRKQSQNTIVNPVRNDRNFQDFEDLLDHHVRKQSEKTAQTYSAQSPRHRASALQSLSSPKKRAASSSTVAGVEEAESRLVDAEPYDGKVVSDSAGYLSVASPPAASVMLQTFVYQSPERQISALKSLTKVQSQAEKVTIGRAALTDQHRVRTTVGLNGLSAKSSAENLRGSEDALVPDSEEEASEADEAVAKSMSLKSFVFTG